MKRLLIYCAILIAVFAVLWLLPQPRLFDLTRTASVRLEPAGYDLSFSVFWGWNMDQKFTLDPVGSFFGGPSSGWSDIWAKPYNAVLTVYRSLDGTYYFGTGWQHSFSFEPASGALLRYCKTPPGVKLTSLGVRLQEAKDWHEAEASDPGTPRLGSWVNDDDSGDIPASPPRSRYYEDLMYLGKFGVVKGGSRRGADVGFAPSDKVAEPRFGLDASCG